MIHVSLPLGTTHGWGIAGRQIVQGLARLAPLAYFPADPLRLDLVEDEFELAFLQSLIAPGVDPLNPSEGYKVDGPVLRGIPAIGHAACPQLRGPWNVGYTFFEYDVLAVNDRATFAEFDAVVAGCTWCADVLRNAGHSNVKVIIQGIEPRVFNPTLNEKQYFQDRFVVFSGGKLELRKGQDIVIAAMGVMQQRHDDVMLVNSWFNPWNATAATIAHSQHIKVPHLSGQFVDVVNSLLAANGLDMSRVLTLGPRANPLMARAYRNSDVGLFPNRCEGGTNLVMCEYMACGKSAIAAYNSGQMDILTDQNSRPMRTMTAMPVRDGQQIVANWSEPDLEETIAHLEWAYQNRDELKKLGTRAGEDLSKITWAATAEQFLRALNRE